MLYYCKMRWNIRTMSFGALWMVEGEEARTAIDTIESGLVQHLYKVAAEQYVVAIGNFPIAEELDRMAMGRLPMREFLIFEEVFSLEEGFTLDVKSYLRPRRERITQQPRLLYFVQLAWDHSARQLDELWDRANIVLRDLASVKVLGLYRVAGQQRVIVIVDVGSAADLNVLSNLPVLASPSVEKVWALRDYHLFAEDVWRGYNV